VNHQLVVQALLNAQPIYHHLPQSAKFISMNNHIKNHQNQSLLVLNQS
jgi:hypothetical protein